MNRGEIIKQIWDERERQVEKYDPDHDAEHTDGELAEVAGYLCAETNDPWGLYSKHHGNRVRQLTIAGALIVAEIERLSCLDCCEGCGCFAEVMARDSDNVPLCDQCIADLSAE